MLLPCLPSKVQQLRCLVSWTNTSSMETYQLCVGQEMPSDRSLLLKMRFQTSSKGYGQGTKVLCAEFEYVVYAERC